ncbi:MAG: SAM hydrolase/SAM-dependent halogenase family protein [Acidimicrobiales bacterium]
MSFDTISFISDFGLVDESVGVTKSVIWSLAPSVRIVDITHGIDAHDVRAGGLAIARAAQYLLPGVVLGVIDPGTGTERKPVCIEVGGGQSYLVGPDNGLFAPAVGMVGGATNAWVLDNSEFHLSGIGTTFAGRDIFAPVSAHLSRGVPPEQLGSPIDPALLLPGVLPVAQTNDEGQIEAEVLWIDRFGNVQLNVDPDAVKAWPAVRVEGNNTSRAAMPVHTYSAISTGSIGVLGDASGLLALAVDRGSAAEELGVVEGDQLTLSRTDTAGIPVAVQLSATKENPEQ